MKCNLCGKTMRYSRGEGRCVRCEDDSLLDLAVDVLVATALPGSLSTDAGISSAIDSLFDSGSTFGGGGDFGGGGASGDW